MLNSFSCVRFFATPWTVAHQDPLSTGFSRQECWSGLPCPPPGCLPDSRIKSTSPALHTGFLPLSHRGSRCYSYLLSKSSASPLVNVLWCASPIQSIVQASELVWSALMCAASLLGLLDLQAHKGYETVTHMLGTGHFKLFLNAHRW